MNLASFSFGRKGTPRHTHTYTKQLVINFSFWGVILTYNLHVYHCTETKTPIPSEKVIQMHVQLQFLCMGLGSEQTELQQIWPKNGLDTGLDAERAKQPEPNGYEVSMA